MGTTSVNYSEFAKYNKETGELDVDASTEVFVAGLRDWDAKNRNDLETVKAAIHAVFDKALGAKFNRQALNSYVLAHMGITSDPSRVAEIPMVHDRIESVLKLHTAEFASKKGRDGGVWRKCDEKPAAESK